MRYSFFVLSLMPLSVVTALSARQGAFLASLFFPRAPQVQEKSREKKPMKCEEPRVLSFLLPFNEPESEPKNGSPGTAKGNKKKQKNIPSAPCTYSLQSEQIQLRHIEGKGVGYNQGYTTLQAFFSAHCGDFYPQLDLRAHVFNDGKLAANAGLALRYVGDRVYGVHAFYDYRQTTHFHYNQCALGFDMLGQWVDFRLNGYFPLGRKESHSFHHKKELSLAGVNAEVGVHLWETDSVKLYGAAGPYYFGKRGQNAWGGEMRASATFYDHLRAELSGSYDTLFHWIGQAQVSLIYFFGPTVKAAARQDRSCEEEAILRKRATQWIDRSEIIVLDHHSD